MPVLDTFSSLAEGREAADEIRNLNRQTAEIMADPATPPEEKQRRVDELRSTSGYALPTPASTGPRTNALADFERPVQTSTLVGLTPPGAEQPRTFGDFGLGASQAAIGRAGREFQGQMTGLQGQQEGLLEQRRQTLEGEKGTIHAQAAAEGALLEQRFNKMRELEARDAEIEAQRKGQVDKDMGALNDARTNLRYFNMDPEARRKAEATLNDPTADDRQREKAREALDKGSKIDPGRLLGSARNQVFAAIAQAMGTYASAFGVQNTATQIVQNAIDRDIMAQKEAQEARRGEVAESKSLLDMNRERFADERQAVLATKIQMLEMSQLEMERAKARYGADRDTAQLDRAIQDTQQAAIDTQAKFAEASYQNTVRGASAQADIAGKRAAVAAAGAKADGGGQQIPPGLKVVSGYKPSDKDIQSGQKIVSSAAALRNAIGRLKDIRGRAGTGGFEVLDRDLVNEGKSALADAITAYKDAKELGALDKGSLELADDVLGGDPTGMGAKMARYDALLKAIERDTQGRLKPYGLTTEGDASTIAGMQRGRAE